MSASVGDLGPGPDLAQQETMEVRASRGHHNGNSRGHPYDRDAVIQERHDGRRRQAIAPRGRVLRMDGVVVEGSLVVGEFRPIAADGLGQAELSRRRVR